MNRREFLKTLEGIVIGSIPLISGCSKNPLKSESELNSNSIIKNNIEYYIRTDKKEYKLGEKVEMLYSVTNKGNKDVKFNILVSPEWNFWVEKDRKTILTSIKLHRAFSPGIKLSAGESKEFTYIWGIRDDEGNFVNAGKYNVIGGFYSGSGEYDYTKISVPITIISSLSSPSSIKL